MGLLDIRDELAAARDFVGCLYLACQHLQAREERSALCAVTYDVRKKLQAIDVAIAELIGGEASVTPSELP